MNPGVYTYCFSSCLRYNYLKAQRNGIQKVKNGVVGSHSHGVTITMRLYSHTVTCNNPLKYTDPSGYMSQHYIVQTNMYAEMSRIALQLSANRQEAWGDMKAQIGSGSLLGNMYLGLAIFGSLHSGGGGSGGTNPATADAPDGGDGEPDDGKTPIVSPQALAIGYLIAETFLSTDFDKACFLNYWALGGVNIQLTEDQYKGILNLATIGNAMASPYDYYLRAISLPADYEFSGSIGESAYLIYDQKDNIVGFIDTYDFNLDSKRTTGQLKVWLANTGSFFNQYSSSFAIYYLDPKYF